MTTPQPSPPSRLGDLSAVAQDYLKAVWNAQEWSSRPLSVKELAARLGLTAGTVSEGVRRLADAGLIDHARYGQIALTPQGRHAALAVVRRHRLVETLLVQTFGYSWDEVHDEAEVLEHAISDELERRIDAHLGHPSHDPHGDPIPSAEGDISIPAARHLSDLGTGECGVVTRVSDADPELLQRLAQVRLVPGEHVVVTDRDGASAVTFVAARAHDDGGEGEGDGGTAPSHAAPVPFGQPALAHVWVVPG
ncbi:metal-dependent transcriptional regulator [Litorihabitans aurantiacus]|uniref:Manganese transport regulator n=1 Tax=Litorihabitans aurantiacus TaxID=1930061 RepID=A0AA37UUF0_9MICO|nr:metal-dependent transcriptional regulator [Litorihabitans aurantiacus]GMA30747.1 DtxR family transcriptional regulator [Litorihabitans aurantiacus]